MSEKHMAMLGVSSSKLDIANGKRRIRICGIVIVPEDFPETETGWEKWLVEMTIKPVEKFVPKYPVGDANEVMISLGPSNIGRWEKKKEKPTRKSKQES